VSPFAWGYRYGISGRALPKYKPRTHEPVPQEAHDGYAYGRRGLCWELWCAKHGKRFVLDGPEPANDPLPIGTVAAERWLRLYEKRKGKR
jgi:hypothetical protein